jgi:hypothetical protein
MSEISEQDLEDYIVDWYHDKPSKRAARKLGHFIFKFLSWLEAEGASERTTRSHDSNCWLICKFLVDYEEPKELSTKTFKGDTPYLYEFKRKVSDSEHARKSYIRTWKKLCKFQALGNG